MGDRIAILGERSVIRQIDTPERILAYPVDEFVDDFIGSGSTLKGLNFERVRDLDLTPYPTMRLGESTDSGLRVLAEARREWILLLDEQDRPLRWLRHTDLERGNGDLRQRGQHIGNQVEPNATLHDTLEEMLRTSSGTCPVVDDRGQYRGVVEINDLTEVIRRLRAEAKQHYDTLEGASA
jgi:osmoprotectant transport system ATP-binding protein